MVRTLLTFSIAALFGTAALAADVKYPLTGENTKLTFTGTKPGGKHDGGFKTLTGSATVTDADFKTLKLDVEITCDSLYSDDEKLTGHLKSPDFFGVKDNPKASFKSTKVEKTDTGFTITGDLTMLGKTKSVTFPASISEKDGVLSLSTSFGIDRTQWGMVYGKGKVDDTVSLGITVTAKK